jgi:hypothetical protein
LREYVIAKAGQMDVILGAESYSKQTNSNQAAANFKPGRKGSKQACTVAMDGIGSCIRSIKFCRGAATLRRFRLRCLSYLMKEAAN